MRAEHLAPEQMAIGETPADCRACVAQRAEVRRTMSKEHPHGLGTLECASCQMRHEREAMRDE
jgi:hypothetical protein